MAALEFPASPTDGDIYGNYQWNATDGVWQLLPVATGGADGGLEQNFLLMGA